MADLSFTAVGDFAGEQVTKLEVLSPSNPLLVST
jgi:hypothetical protein